MSDNNSNGNNNTNETATFVDTQMAHWTIFETIEDGDVTQNEATQVADSGPGAPSPRMMVAVGEGSSAVIIHVPTQFQLPWSTDTQNGLALDHLDLALDQQLSYTTTFEGYIEGGFVVVQDDIVYRTTSATISSSAWETDERAGLTAADFADVEGRNPDLSVTGGVLRFGYYRVVDVANSSAGEIDFVDNYSITAVPVPQTGLTLTSPRTGSRPFSGAAHWGRGLRGS